MAESKKKFCPDCGKQLVAGQKHECGKDNGFNTDTIVEKVKGYCNDLVSMIKKPATTLKKKCEEGNLVDGLIILGVLALVAGLFMIMAIKPLLIMTIKSTTGLKITEIPKGSIHYFKLFITTVLSAIIFAFVPIIVTFVTGKIAKKKDFSFASSVSLYAYANLVIIPLYFILGIIMLTQVSFLITICSLVISFVALVCFVNYISAVIDVLSFKDDHKGYAVSSIIFAWIALVVVILMICGNAMFGDLTGTSSTPKSSSSTSTSIFKF